MEIFRFTVHVHCITVWQIKTRGKKDHSLLQSLAGDRMIVTLTLVYWPCPQFKPPRDYFRTTKMGLCLPKGPKDVQVIKMCKS